MVPPLHHRRELPQLYCWASSFWPTVCSHRIPLRWEWHGRKYRAAMWAVTVLAATGYIVAHHKINLNSKVTGRVKWIGVEKGDKVQEGQIFGAPRRR